MVSHFHVPQFHVSHFQRPRQNLSIFSKLSKKSFGLRNLHWHKDPAFQTPLNKLQANKHCFLLFCHIADDYGSSPDSV